MDMSKFSSVHDQGYRSISGEIRRWLKAIRTKQETERFPEVVYTTRSDDPPAQPSTARIEQTAPATSEPAQAYFHPYPQSYGHNYHPNESAYHYRHTHANTQPYCHVPYETMQPDPPTQPYDHPQYYEPNEAMYAVPRNYHSNPNNNFVSPPQKEREQGGVGQGGVYQGGNTFYGPVTNNSSMPQIVGNFNGTNFNYTR